MEKYVTYLETRVGNKTYTLTVESDKPFSTFNNVYWYAEQARVVKVIVHGSNTNDSPFKEGDFYDSINFPVVSTMMSVKKFEY